MPSTLADVPIALPGLTRAVKLQDKAAKVGFDWPSLGPVLDKMKEELTELEEALRADARSGAAVIAFDDRLESSGPLPTAEIEEEFGDLLFVMANVARHLKLDPEAALRRANAKFNRRFIGLRRHDEIILVESLHHMRPQLDSYFPILQQSINRVLLFNN